MLLGLVTAAVALVIDQASKYWILHDVLEDKAMIIFTPFFSLVRAWNTGVSFSMFNDWGLSGVIVLSLVAFVIIAGQLAEKRAVQTDTGFFGAYYRRRFGQCYRPYPSGRGV